MNYRNRKMWRKRMVWMAALFTFVATMTLLWTDAGGIVM